MPAEDALLFIDANKYLDLYQAVKGRALLAPLTDIAKYVVVTQQVVDEVTRNKVAVAARFLSEQLKEGPQISVPDHLCGATEEQAEVVRKRARDISKSIKDVKREISVLAEGIMTQICTSTDEVSKALAPIFDRALSHTPDELMRARDRRERGNPPGKPDGPLGDQLTWEQILSHFRETNSRRLWVISRDGDYGTFFRNKGYLNAFMLREVNAINPQSEVHLFDKMAEGIRDFTSNTGVTAKELLSEDATTEISNEEASLPPISTYDKTLWDALLGGKYISPSELVPGSGQPFTYIMLKDFLYKPLTKMERRDSPPKPESPQGGTNEE